tara:strand:+ start:4945 stop:5439 length:495 start_codon:yes stop_codon:yes gene_type:complete
VKRTKTKNIEFQDGEWWYVGQADGRRRVASHEKKNDTRMWVDGKYVKKSYPLHKPGRYKTTEEAAYSSFENYETATEGEVYIITNPAWKGWVKVGMAVDAEDRCKQYQTSSPMRDFKLEYSRSFKNRRSAETTAHRELEKISNHFEGEWFNININKVIEVIESI